MLQKGEKIDLVNSKPEEKLQYEFYLRFVDRSGQEIKVPNNTVLLDGFGSQMVVVKVACEKSGFIYRFFNLKDNHDRKPSPGTVYTVENLGPAEDLQ